MCAYYTERWRRRSGTIGVISGWRDNWPRGSMPWPNNPRLQRCLREIDYVLGLVPSATGQFLAVHPCYAASAVPAGMILPLVLY